MRTERKPGDDGIVVEPSKPPADAFCSLDEQRKSTRFPKEEGTDFAAVWQEAGEEILVEVHDESLTGLGILVDDSFDVQLGGRLQVVYAGEYLEAEVRHITCQSSGRKLVGLRCRRLVDRETQ